MNSPDEPKGLPIDFPALKERYKGQNVTRLLRMFLDDVPQLIDTIKTNSKSRNQVCLLRDTHGLKGISGTVFAGGVFQICTAIETSGRDNDWDTTDLLIARLEQEFEDCAAFTKELLSQS